VFACVCVSVVFLLIAFTFRLPSFLFLHFDHSSLCPTIIVYFFTFPLPPLPPPPPCPAPSVFSLLLVTMDTSFDLQPQQELCQDPSDNLSDHANLHNHYHHHQQYQQQQQQYQYPPPPPPTDASNRPQYYHPWSSSNLSLPSLSSMNSLSSLSSFDIGSSTNTLLGSTLPYPANAAGSSPNSLSSSLNASSFASSSSLDSFAASGALGASLSYPFVCPLEFEGLLQSYLLSLHVRKRSKALIEQSMADDCLMVLTNPENTKIFGPKFRWWVRKHFVYTTTTSMVAPEDGSEPQQQQQCILMDRKNGKPVCVKEKLYEKVAHFHEATGHGGRDKTFKAVSFFFPFFGLFTFFYPLPACRQMDPFLSPLPLPVIPC